MATNMTHVSQETFEAHQNLLMDVIKRQAGSLSKAVLEAVMNSIDAGAKHVHVLLDADQLIIRDDGRGFTSAKEIRNNFRVFGLPQDELEKATKTYGHFRMGRGQLFAFGVNTWTTNKFRMADIDVNANGLKWSLQKADHVLYNGCQVEVELYEQLTDYQIRNIRDELTRSLRYSPTPVLFNGEKLTVDPATESWPHASDGYLARFDRSNHLTVYNRGVLVREYYSRGCGGVVISQEKLLVNFARNDIMESCPLWRRIQKASRGFAGEQLAKQKSFTPAERIEAVRQFLVGDLSSDQFYTMEVFRTHGNRPVSWRTLQRASRNYPCLTFAATGDRKALHIARHKRAYVLDENTKELGGHVDPAETIKQLNAAMPTYRRLRTNPDWPIVPLEQLVEDLSDDVHLVPPEDLSPEDKFAMALLRPGHTELLYYLNHRCDAEVTQRQVLLGETVKDYLAGTDGLSTIMLNRESLRKLNLFDVGDLVELGLALVSAYAAAEDTLRATPSDQEYYERYYAYAPAAGVFAKACLRRAQAVLKKLGKDMTKQQLRALAELQSARFAQQQLLELADTEDDDEDGDA